MIAFFFSVYTSKKITKWLYFPTFSINMFVLHARTVHGLF